MTELEERDELGRAAVAVMAAFPDDRQPSRKATEEELAPLVEAGWSADDLGRRLAQELARTEVGSSPDGLLHTIAGRLAQEDTPAIVRERARRAKLEQARSLGHQQAEHYRDEEEARSGAQARYRGPTVADGPDLELVESYVAGWRDRYHAQAPDGELPAVAAQARAG